MRTTKDDFELWLANPVTEEVFRAFAVLSEKAKAQWVDTSWNSGVCDPVLRADLHARAEVVDDFRELSFEALEEWLSDEK